MGFFPGPAGGAGRGRRPTRWPRPCAAALGDWRRGRRADRGHRRRRSTPGSACARASRRRGTRWRSGSTTIRPAATRSRRRWRRPGSARPDREAMGEVEALAQALDPGDFAQFVAKLALYKRGDPAPLGPADIAACAPPAAEADLDEVVMLAADGDGRPAGGGLRRAGRARRQPDRRSPSPPAATSARSTPPPAPATGRTRRWPARARRSSGRSGRGWRRRRGRSGRSGSSRRWR